MCATWNGERDVMGRGYRSRNEAVEGYIGEL